LPFDVGVPTKEEGEGWLLAIKEAAQSASDRVRQKLHFV